MKLRIGGRDYDESEAIMEVGDDGTAFISGLVETMEHADLSVDIPDGTYEPPIPPGTYVQPPADTEKLIYVRSTGSDSDHGKTSDKPKLTFAGALAAIGAGNAGHIDMDGVVDLGAGASLSGHRCTFAGKGDRTILRVTGTQVGAALDFTGYLSPASATSRRKIANFAVEGDNTAGTAKKGVNFGSVTGMTFEDISVSKTGGAPFDFGGSELCDFSRLIANQPVSCYANDVPYFMGTGACNGNRFAACGLRSVTAVTAIAAGSNGATLPQATINVTSAANFAAAGTTYVATAAGPQLITYTGKTSTTLTGCTGGTTAMATGDTVIATPDSASGLVRFTDDGSFAPEGNEFEGWWLEFLQLPTGGSVFALAGNKNHIALRRLFDCGKLTGATNTCFVKLNAVAFGGGGSGANEVTGIIPGRSTTATSIDYGVIVAQSRNRIRGTKGFRGNNVLINSGVDNTHGGFEGEESDAVDAAVVDNSGTTTNLIAGISRTFTASGTYIVPANVSALDILCVAGGGGGGGGGAALTSGGVTAQTGGGGGAAGTSSRQIVACAPGQSVAVVVGAGGTAGTAGAANGGAGGSGGNGVVSSASSGSSPSFNVRGTGGTGGQGGGSNITTARSGGLYGSAGFVSTSLGAGCGGTTPANNGGAPIAGSGGGGAGGGTATSTLGGGGGGGGNANNWGLGAGVAGTSTGTDGGAGATNTGAGGGGGGGGAPGGAGGAGGAGGSGYVVIRAIP